MTTAVRLTDAFSADYLEYHGLLPLRVEDTQVVVATWLDQPDDQALDDLRMLFQAEVALVRVAEDDLSGLLPGVEIGQGLRKLPEVEDPIHRSLGASRPDPLGGAGELAMGSHRRSDQLQPLFQLGDRSGPRRSGARLARLRQPYRPGRTSGGGNRPGPGERRRD